MVKKVRVGIVGVGFGERILLPAFRQHSNCEVTAICSTNLERARDVAAKHGIEKAYGDWKNLVHDRDVVGIAIATPPSAQAEIAMGGLQAGKSVFCEKPLAVLLNAAQNLMAAAQPSNLANMVDFEFPEIPAWQRSKSILEQGSLGKLRSVKVNWIIETYGARKQSISWKTNINQGGGTLFSFAPHVFYHVEWLFGPIQELSCTISPKPSAGGSGDTFVSLSMVTANGTPVSVVITTNSFLGSGHSIEVYGESGTLVLRNPGRDYIKGFRLWYGTRESQKLEEVAVSEEDMGGGDGRIYAVGKLVGKFSNWIQSGQPAKPSFREGLRVQELLEHALISSREGRRLSCLPS